MLSQDYLPMLNLNWNITRSRELYNIAHWSNAYFDINAQGHVVAYPKGNSDGPAVDLYALGRQLNEAGLALPVLVRFVDILHHRIDMLCDAFARAMQTENYQASYTAVYPIKVNQQSHVVKEILAAGGTRVGLEAGSKPELLTVLALASPGATIICNGYKDREFIRLALIGQQLGLHTYIVIEKSSELPLIIEEARAMNITPELGVRVRLASIGSGKWQNTGGEKGKFGLSSAQILQVIEHLQKADMLQNLKLMHFHMGSQIANIRDVHAALREAARYYAQIYALGASLQILDVGGGLGVDYEGTHSRSFCSLNYSVQEYANNVVHTFAELCKECDLPFPHIITESGRAMTAHHAVLLTNITDVEDAPGLHIPEPPAADEPRIIQDLWEGLANLGPHSAVEAYHDATYWLSEVHAQFTHGVLDLPQRARAEQLYFATCQGVRNLLHAGSRTHREILDDLNEKLADKYFINLSLFQSIPDAWAIEQVFPIVPLQRLYERPDRRAVLQDLTCDSDGRIDSYVDAEGLETSLPVHSLKADEVYMVGIFLVGAYQEILGDMHNLFGDTHAVNVMVQADGSYCLSEAEQGDTVEDMLRYVHFDPDNLRQRYRARLQECALSEILQDAYLAELENGLQGYTYLE
jgi:arginine decarboxylase